MLRVPRFPHFLTTRGCIRSLGSCSSSSSSNISSSHSSSHSSNNIDSKHNSPKNLKKSVGAVAALEEQQDGPLLTAARPITPWPMTPRRSVPSHIVRPPYADTGYMPVDFFGSTDAIILHDRASIGRMRTAARLARKILDMACDLASQPGNTTDDIDAQVHDAIIANDAYPSPLNYANFPKSVCTSINEVICHGIPDTRRLELGDVVSFDVSCFVGGVHGDNCATIIVGDSQEQGDDVDWRGVPYRQDWTGESEALRKRVEGSRRLVQAARDGLYAGIEACRPGGCLSHVGCAIHQVADDYGFDTVRKYRGHGIAHVFHTAPYVKHFRNSDRLELKEGMIFTIEPMFTAGQHDCHEWADEWTVVTNDGGLAAQFEHTVLITERGVEILTLPESEWSD